MNTKNIFLAYLSVPFQRWNCSCVSNFIPFRTSHERNFLVFGVPNAKYLAFDTPDGSALS